MEPLGSERRGRRPGAVASTKEAGISSRPRLGEGPTAIQKIVAAWLLWGLALAVAALLPSRHIDRQAESRIAAGVMAPAYRNQPVPAHNGDDDRLGRWDVTARDAQHAMKTGHAQAAVPGDGDEADDARQCATGEQALLADREPRRMPRVPISGRMP